MKKTKQPGENISLKTKKTEDPAVMNWINAQTNLMDSLRYLIEHEIRQNGVRNLQTFIPAERNVLGSIQEFSAPVPSTGASASMAAVNVAETRVGMQEIIKGMEGVSAGETVVREEREQPNLTSPPEESKQPATLASPPAKPDHTDDEIADEDIEAWV